MFDTRREEEGTTRHRTHAQAGHGHTRARQAATRAQQQEQNAADIRLFSLPAHRALSMLKPSSV